MAMNDDAKRRQQDIRVIAHGVARGIVMVNLALIFNVAFWGLLGAGIVESDRGSGFLLGAGLGTLIALFWLMSITGKWEPDTPSAVPQGPIIHGDSKADGETKESNH